MTLRRMYLFLVFLCSACATPQSGQTHQSPIHKPLFDEVEFIKHLGPRPMQTYLAMNLNAQGLDSVRRSIEQRTQTSLKHRGEAHITVITPVEFDKYFRPLKGAGEFMNERALELGIQRLPFEIVCIGQGQKAEMSTFYYVVKSQDLLNLRNQIAKELFEQLPHNVETQMLKESWKKEVFYPHITLGFTHRDLHFEEGVTKDSGSCIKIDATPSRGY